MTDLSTNDNAASSAIANLPDVANGFVREVSNAAAGIDLDTRSLVHKATHGISRAIAAADAGAAKADATMRDKTMYPEGRQELAREALAEAQAKADEALREAETLATIAEATLVTQALPAPNHREAGTARQDAMMVLDSKHGNLSDKIRQLAQRSDAVGQLVATPWLADYLSAHGHDRQYIDALTTVAQHEALKATAESGNERAAAARAALAVQVEMQKARTTARSYSRMRLNRYV